MSLLQPNDLQIIRENSRNEAAYQKIIETINQNTSVKSATELAVGAEILGEQIFSHNRAVALIIDPTSNQIVDVNPAACAFYGYSRDTFLTLSMADLDALHQDEVALEIALANAEDRMYRRFPHRLASGEIREIEAHMSMIDMGEHELQFLIIRDVTEHRNVEFALQKSEANLRAVFHSNSLLLALIDEHEKFIDINQPMKDKMRQISDREPSTGDSVYDFIPETEKYGFRIHYENALKGESITLERQIQLDPNHKSFVEFRYVPVTTQTGNIIGVYLSAENITDRKRGEQALEYERNLLRTVIDTLPDAMWIKDAKGRFITVNIRQAALARVAAPVDLVGKTDRDVFPEYGEEYYADDLQVLDTGKAIIDKEEPIVDPEDGSIGWHLTTKVPLLGPKREVIGMVGIGRDVTQRKQTEEALRYRDALLNVINTTTQQFLIVEDWRYVIDDMLALLGTATNVSRVHIFQSHYQDDGTQQSILKYEWTAKGILSAIQDSAGKEFNPQAIGFSSWAKLLESGQGVSGHTEDLPPKAQEMLRSLDIESMLNMPIIVGQTRWGTIGFDACFEKREWTEVELEVLRTAASTLGSAIQRQQILEGLRESEEKFLQLADHIPEVFWIRDVRKDQLVYISPAYETVWGKSCESAYENPTPFSDAFHPDDYDRVTSEIAEQYRRIPLNQEYRIIRPDKSERWIFARTFPIPNEMGEVYRVVGVAEDITERKHAETRRLQVMAERERTRVLADFVRDASHEFKTPLSIINTSLYLMSRTEDDPEKSRRYMESIQRQVDDITKLVEALIMMSQLDTRTNPSFGKVPVYSALRQVEATALRDFEGKDISVTFDLTEDLPTVFGNTAEIGQAVSHLLQNALTFTPEGGMINVRSYAEGDEVVIAVQDTGVGIDEDTLPKIFNRFFRADEAHSTRGFGLGLPIAKKIIEQHGGRIEAESTLGEGSTFKIILPAPLLQMSK